MVMKYNFVFCVGQNYHRVELFEKYTDENGCINKLHEFESSRAVDLRKQIKSFLTKEQLTKFDSLSKHREDGIITENGSYYNY